MAAHMITVMIVDDQRLLREGMQTILQSEQGLEVVALCGNGLEAVQKAEELKPDVILMDIKMPVMDGIEAMKRIKNARPNTIVLMLTTFMEDRFIVEALAAGAEGFLLKDMPSKVIIQTIRDAVNGEVILPARIASKLAGKLSVLYDDSSPMFDDRKLREQGLYFTEREKKIIMLMIEGYNNRKIASTLFMSEGTVRNYISGIYNKLGTNDRQEANAMLRSCLLEDSY
jgi:DNA-binding NarL/FixJ family response regulator